MSSRSALLIFAVGTFLCIALSGTQLPELNRLRKEQRFVHGEELQGAPPEYAILTTALGGFRGLLADFLWLRAIRLERQSRHFELVQLYDWIGKLEPTIPEIWLLNSHNLAYNLSFAMPEREDRWLWIQRAIELLRDQGLRYNPRSYEIYLQLAWLYLHKIGGRADDFHWHYKTHLALQMQRTLGTLDPDLEAIADPGLSQEWDEFARKRPNAASLAARAAASGIDLSKAYGELRWDEAQLDKAQRQFLTGPENQEALGKIAAFYAAKTLREDWGLEPGRMHRLRKEYGPIDWRLADSIAFYWASKANEMAATEQEKENTNRVFYISFVNLFRRGRLFLQPQGEDHLYITQPELRFAKPLAKYFEKVIEEAPLAKHAHEAFLEELVYTLFTYNQEKEARKQYAILGKTYGKTGYQVPFEEYINTHLVTDIRTANYNQAMVMLNGLVRQAFWWRAVGEDDRFIGFMSQANRVWKIYDRTRADREKGRLELPSIPKIKERVLQEALNTQSPMAFPPLLRERLQEQLEESPDGPSDEAPR